MLPANHDLWREYIKLELGWVEALRRRWKVLGIANTAQPTAKSVEERIGGEGSFGPEGEDARKAILGGQLVLQAIRSALAATPVTSGSSTTTLNGGLDFREGLLATLRAYPSPLRLTCLEVVYADLEKAAEGGGRAGAQARMLLLTRGLYDRPYEAGRKDDGRVVLEGVELVEAVGTIGKEIRKAVKIAGPEFGEVAGVWLDQRIQENRENPELVSYHDVWIAEWETSS
jgi:U3 small nucleolar RNA-associated protein 6